MNLRRGAALGLLGFAVAGWAGCGDDVSPVAGPGASTDGGGGGGARCVSPTVDCGGRCVDVRLDRASCGACGVACALSEVCSEGRCGRECSGGTERCIDRCIEPAADPLNCGGCGKACSAGQTCANATCGCSAPGMTVCGAACVDTKTSAAHCGRCNAPCAAADECVAGACKGPIAEWRFEGTLDDSIGGAVGRAEGAVGFYDTSWSTVRGKSLRLDGASSVVVPAPGRLPLGAAPRTIEAWVWPGALADTTYNGIVSYGVRGANTGQLLSLQQDGRLSSAQWANDLLQTAGTRIVSSYGHVAYTWDGTRRRLYIDGEEVAADVPPPFATAAGDLRIGSTDAPGRLFTGAIDDVRIYDFARSPAALRATANADVVYRFDPGAETVDSGPNRTTRALKSAAGLGAGTGRDQLLNGALTFDGAATTQLQIVPVHVLGRKDRPYTMMVWIEPEAVNGTIAHVSGTPAGTGWCVAFLGLRAGKLVASSWLPTLSTVSSQVDVALGTWTHVATTWSSAAGLRLYVNGALVNSVAQATFLASGSPMFVTLGNQGEGTGCGGGSFGSYKGAMDELKIFDRELTAAEIAAAMNQ